MIDSNSFLISMVNVDDSVIDLSHINDPKLHSQLLPLIQNNTPHKIKNIPVKINILLTDDVSICSSPRQLSQAEKKLLKLKSQNSSIKELMKFFLFSSSIVLVKKKDITHIIFEQTADE